MSAAVEDNAAPPLHALMRLFYQHWRSPAIYVATRLGIADVLADDSRTLAELAGPTDTHAPSLYRLLRALARIGVFTELAGLRFANSELSHLLRTDVSGLVPAQCRRWRR